MIGRETCGHLDLALKAIMQNSSPFGGESFEHLDLALKAFM